MDAQGNIYEVDDHTVSNQPENITIEDMARLDGFLRGRAEADKVRHEKFVEKAGKQIWDSQTQGTYRKAKMGNKEDIEHSPDEPEAA